MKKARIYWAYNLTKAVPLHMKTFVFSLLNIFLKIFPRLAHVIFLRSGFFLKENDLMLTKMKIDKVKLSLF